MLLFPIKNISLINYRCFDNLNISFRKKLTFLYGNNGIGKTSLLEAIFLIMAKKKLFKAQNLELIKKSNDMAFIKSDIEIDNSYKSRSSTININNISFAINNIQDENKQEQNSFYFSSTLIYDFVKNKRVRLNTLLRFISHKDSEFKNNLKKLESLIEAINWQKNEDSNEFKFLECQIRALEEKITPIIRDFIESYNKQDIKILNKNYIEIIESKSFRSHIKTILNNDVKLTNNFGDLTTMSQGQKRLTVISFVLELIKNLGNIKLILLDDIFDELDNNNRDYICNLCEDFQTIITSSKNLEFSEWINVEKVRLYNESK